MFQKLLIANRGEIAVRIARTAREMGIEPVVVYSEDDAGSAHVALGPAHPLSARGAPAYLDIEAMIAAAAAHGCDAIHPGYGFLSENAAFARACDDAGIRFVGPTPGQLELFGDKARALTLAKACDVPVVAGTDGPASLEDARAFLDALGPGGAVMIKALAGGGGRGMRAVEQASELEEAYRRCRSEAMRSFGRDEVYVERLVRRARHVEVQIVGDGVDVVHFWERECSLQRQNQKMVEIAPAIGIDAGQRGRLLDAALRMATESRFENLGTFEFLVDLDRPGTPEEYCFIEANPRIQVEHTVTEEILGLDLVRLQLQIAAGQSLAGLGITQDRVPAPRGHAIQLRINMEAMDASGRSRPSSGTLDAFSPPGGPGVRVDSFGYAGYATVSSFDSLLAKLIVSSSEPEFTATLARARRAAAEFRIEGVATNLPFLRGLLDHPDLAAGCISTRFVERNIGELLAALPPSRPVERAASPTPIPEVTAPASGENGLLPVAASQTGLLVDLTVAVGDHVVAGDPVAVVEAMKMEHVVSAPVGGIVRALPIAHGGSVALGDPIVMIDPAETSVGPATASPAIDLDLIRGDLAAVREQLAATLDEARPEALAKRRARGQRTARENIADLCDPGSFLEYGQLAVAFRHSRGTADELRKTSPADGMITGIGTINRETFGAEAASAAVAAYDFTVFAGTQGQINHRKTDRLIDIAGERGLPLVIFAEGGGGRPGDDPTMVAGLGTPTFAKLARLGGAVPTIGIAAGRCFAGNAALLGLMDAIIATEDSNIGMGGPALIEAAGLGAFTPEQVGPIDVQCTSGVVDIRVADETAAVATAKTYLSFFQGDTGWTAGDPRRLRHAIPENRLRAYDVREVARLIADDDAYLELRRDFGRGYVTALIRVEGRPIGLLANNPLHGAGAIDSDGADKAARFLRLCNAHGLPLLTLIDTPGIMIGPEAEATALVRHAGRLFAAAAAATVPHLAIVLRKAYGLGAMAAAGGHLHVPLFTAAWPTAELGGMGLEGAVRLGHKRQLEAIADPAERRADFEAKVAAAYERGKGSNAAAYFELDAVIDPADTRAWIVRGLNAAHGRPARRGGFVDSW